ncbi:unnamed protein product, partial [Polarella glacialis]
VHHDLVEVVSQLVGQRSHVTYGIAFVGSLSHLFLGSSAVVDFQLAGARATAVNAVFSTVCITFCSDFIAINLTLRLADSSFGDDVEGSTFFSRNLAGPIAAASLFSLFTATGLAMMSPCLPWWAAALLTAGGIATNLLLIRYPGRTSVKVAPIAPVDFD